MYEHVVQACLRRGNYMVKIKNRHHKASSCYMRMLRVKVKIVQKNRNTTPFLPSKDSRLAMDYFVHSVDNGSGNLNVHTLFPML